MARSKRENRLFNPLKRKKLLRKTIPAVEVVAGAGLLGALVLVAAWVGLQKDRFDPADRDVSFEVLQANSVEDTLYERPLKRWVDPGATRGGAPVLDLGIFPASLLDGGWELDGRVETYDPSNLYEKINGAAEQYLAYGFRRLHYVTLTREGRFLTVELYDQADFRNTLGIFAAQKDSARRAETRDDVFYYATPVGAVGGYENFYFKISGDGPGTAITSKARELIGLIARLPGEGRAAPRPFAVLTGGLGLDFDRISYQRSDVFQYDFLADFWFGKVGEDSQARYFIHEAKDAEEAGSTFRRLVEEQEFEYTVLDRGENRVLLEHRFLKTVFALVREGKMVFGVDGAEDRERSRDHLARLMEGIRVGQRKAGPTS